jgi:hypothetical protein
MDTNLETDIEIIPNQIIHVNEEQHIAGHDIEHNSKAEFATPHQPELPRKGQ